MKTALVVSAHSADFVWRSGGAVALHAEAGVAVTVVCLSFGEKGESAKLWRRPGMTLERVKAEREAEAVAAAQALGVHDLQLWDLGDNPLIADTGALNRLAGVFRAIRPVFLITHSDRDLHNHDHPVASQLAQRARILAQAHGHEPDIPVIGAPPVFLFEPQQPERCGWRPDLLLDIGRVWPRKRAAIECMVGQEHLWEYYTRAAQQRGVQATRNSDKAITWAEAFESVFPQVVSGLG